MQPSIGFPDPDDELNRKLRQLPPEELLVLLWHLKRFPNQIAPCTKNHVDRKRCTIECLPYIWFLLAGRGAGKTLTGAHHIFEVTKNLPNIPAYRIVRVGLVSETFKDVKNTMIEGDTGLDTIIPQDLIISNNRTSGEFKFCFKTPFYREVHCQAYSSERPNDLRGPNNHIVWFDEAAKSSDADKEPTAAGTTWSNIVMSLRSGQYPHIVVTSTPRNNKLVNYIANHENCVTSRMTSLDNTQLPPGYLEELSRLPKTSRTYRQEVLAEILIDNPDSIFDAQLIDQDRADPPEDQDLHLVLGYDPTMSASDDSDEAGIFLSAFTKDKENGTHAYLLEDHSGHFKPPEQVSTVINLILSKEIPELIVEQNQGAGFVLTNIKTALQDHPDVQVVDARDLKKIRASKAGAVKATKYTITFKDKHRAPFSFILYAIHARASKVLRAELAAINYEQHRVHHPTNGLPICHIQTCRASLEDQMVTWGPDSKESPDRLDSAVYTLLHIFGENHALSSKKFATIQTAANARDLPPYDPRANIQDISQLTLSRHSRAYSVDLGGRENVGIDDAHSARSR